MENELQETLRLWTPLKALLETKSLELVDTGVMSVNDVLDVADQTYALRPFESCRVLSLQGIF